MKEMISPYRHTPSARPTNIKDLPSALGSSLIAPSAALAALATAIPPPTQESPVESAAARYPKPVALDAAPACKQHDPCNQKCAEEEKHICCQRHFITLFILFSDQEITEWNNNAKY